MLRRLYAEVRVMFSLCKREGGGIVCSWSGQAQRRHCPAGAVPNYQRHIMSAVIRYDAEICNWEVEVEIITQKEPR